MTPYAATCAICGDQVSLAPSAFEYPRYCECTATRCAFRDGKPTLEWSREEYTALHASTGGMSSLEPFVQYVEGEVEEVGLRPEYSPPLSKIIEKEIQKEGGVA